ncbi:hypothetical protein [Neobacillus drentensis]|uniref:hypothetical protein n=1 Tax=Neobacillus drentensis TaxID=220684 RepID=UPI002FFFB678
MRYFPTEILLEKKSPHLPPYYDFHIIEAREAVVTFSYEATLQLSGRKVITCKKVILSNGVPTELPDSEGVYDRIPIDSNTEKQFNIKVIRSNYYVVTCQNGLLDGSRSFSIPNIFDY